MISYHKIIKFQARNCDIKMTSRDINGVKWNLNVYGFRPYAFISKFESDRLEVSKQYITSIIDEQFRDYFGNQMFTIYFKHPGVVGKQRDIIGPEHLYQADIHYELACAIKKGYIRYVKIDGNLTQNDTIHVDRILPMTEKEIQSMSFAPYKKAFLDIEVSGDSDSIPSTKDVLFPVVSLVVEHEEKTIAYLFGKTDVTEIKHNLYGLKATVSCYDTEEEMLAAAHRFFMLADVGLAWNSNFDQEYLVNRSEKLGLSIDWNTIQWFNLQQAVAAAQEMTSPFLSLKKVFVEDLFMYKRHAWKHLPEIFQDYYSEEEDKNEDDKGKGMVEVNEDSTIYKYLHYRNSQSGGDVKTIYEVGNFRELLFYNACDVWDMLMLQNVGALDSFFTSFDGLGLMNLNDVFFHTSKIEPTALRFCMLNYVASPSKIFQEGTIDEGAIVHDAKRGKVLKNVIVSDFSRFYVSIISALQVSPENINGNENKLFNIMPNGERLPEPMYFLPALAHYLITTRNHAEDMRLVAILAKDELNKEYWTKQTKTLKPLTSGLWGYIVKNGDLYEKDKKTKKIIYVNNKPKLKNKKEWKKAGRYYADHVGDKILGESRSKSLELKNYIETHKIDEIQYEVDYGDSDSVFIEPTEEIDIERIDPEKIDAQVNEFFIDLCKKQGYPYPIKVSVEKIYDRLVLVNKKTYYGRVVWENGRWILVPRYDVKGMQAKRSDNSQLGKDFQYSVIHNHLDHGEMGITRTILKMNKFIDNGFILNAANFIESISTPWKVKKPLKKYESGQWKYWADSAEKWNKYVEDNNLGIDNILGFGKRCFVILIKYCGIEGLNIDNKYLVFTQADLINWSKIEIDVVGMKDKTVQDKINNILLSIGKTKVEIETISKGRRTQRIMF